MPPTVEQEQTKRRRQLIRNRLWLAVTLYNNPQLQTQRGRMRQGREKGSIDAGMIASELYGNI
jgi:hypothetical protein